MILRQKVSRVLNREKWKKGHPIERHLGRRINWCRLDEEIIEESQRLFPAFKPQCVRKMQVWMGMGQESRPGEEGKFSSRHIAIQCDRATSTWKWTHQLGKFGEVEEKQDTLPARWHTLPEVLMPYPLVYLHVYCSLIHLPSCPRETIILMQNNELFIIPYLFSKAGGC